MTQYYSAIYEVLLQLKNKGFIKIFMNTLAMLHCAFSESGRRIHGFSPCFEC